MYIIHSSVHLAGGSRSRSIDEGSGSGKHSSIISSVFPLSINLWRNGTNISAVLLTASITEIKLPADNKIPN